MMNWRDLMAPPPGVLTHPHNPHNPQNGGSRGSSADIADEVVAEKSPVFAPRTQTSEASPLPLPPLTPAPQPGWLGVEAPAPQPGALVTWHRGDGSSPIAFVDFLHLDPDGKEWAFLSYGKTETVVDRRLLSVVTP